MGVLILEIKDLSHGALEQVNMKVEKGDLSMIMGPSGSGKSTLLNLICRMESFSSGKIMVNGVDIASLDHFDKWRAANIGFIFEENNLIPTLTLHENVELPMSAAGIDKAKRDERVMGALQLVGLTGKERLYPKQVDVEEEQRVALARAIAVEPPIILADEPTGKLSTEQTDRFIELMEGLNKRTGRTFVVASHDQNWKRIASTVLEL